MNTISKRTALVTAGLAVLLFSIFFMTGFEQNNARAQEMLNVSSIQGTYAAYSTAETRATINGSVLSVAAFDGAGSWNSSILRNTAVSDFERGLEHLDSFGVYQLQVNGIGFAEANTNENDGASNDANFDFVVTHVEATADGLIATEFYALPRLSSTGRAAGVTFKRLPSESWNDSRLVGTFAVSYFVGENESAGLGSIAFNGQGEFDGTLLSNEPGDAQVVASANYLSCLFPCLIGQGEEVPHLITTNEIDGTYQLQNDGTGIMTLSEADSENTFNILITQADDSGLATELIAVQQDPQGNSGGLRTLVLTRLF